MNDASPGLPRWLKILGGAMAVLVMLMVGVLAVGATQDEPAGHGGGGHAMPSGGMQHGRGNHTRPNGHHGDGSVSEGQPGHIVATLGVMENIPLALEADRDR